MGFVSEVLKLSACAANMILLLTQTIATANLTHLSELLERQGTPLWYLNCDMDSALEILAGKAVEGSAVRNITPFVN